MTSKNAYYVAGGVLGACVLAAVAGFDAGVATDPTRPSRVPGSSLADAGLASAAGDAGSTGSAVATADRDTARPAIVDAFPTEAVVTGWSDVNATELRTRIIATLDPVGLRVSGVECRQRSCYIDVQGDDPREMMAARDLFFSMLSGLSVRSCEFGSLGLDEDTVVQRLYLYCHPGTRPNFAYFDASPNVPESVARLRATLEEMSAAPGGDGT